MWVWPQVPLEGPPPTLDRAAPFRSIAKRAKGGVPSMTALSVPQHKPMCTIAFGGSTRTDDIALGLRRKKSFSLQQRELVETSAALSTTCLSTSVPHSLGTCLETGIYTTVSCGSRAFLAVSKNSSQVWDCRGKAGLFLLLARDGGLGSRRRPVGFIPSARNTNYGTCSSPSHHRSASWL